MACLYCSILKTHTAINAEFYSDSITDIGFFAHSARHRADLASTAETYLKVLEYNYIAYCTMST